MWEIYFISKWPGWWKLSFQWNLQYASMLQLYIPASTSVWETAHAITCIFFFFIESFVQSIPWGKSLEGIGAVLPWNWFNLFKTWMLAFDAAGDSSKHPWQKQSVLGKLTRSFTCSVSSDCCVTSSMVHIRGKPTTEHLGPAWVSLASVRSHQSSVTLAAR